MHTLTEERNRFFKMYEKAEDERISIQKSSKEKIIKLEKSLKDKESELRKINSERSNAMSVKTSFRRKESSFIKIFLTESLK